MCTRKDVRRRAGVLHPILPLLFVLLLALLAFALDPVRLWTIRAELQNNVDADALAAARRLVGDTRLRALLTGNPADLPALLRAARKEALATAKVNPVNARVFELEDNPLNFARGDVIFGTVPAALSRDFKRATGTLDATNAELLGVNTVRVFGRLTRDRGTAPGLIFPQFTAYAYQDVIARGSATLDADVIGFAHTVDRPLPIAPVALKANFQNPLPVSDTDSWQKLVEVDQAPDKLTFDPTAKTFTLAPDGLAEFAASFATENAGVGAATVRLLKIGAPTMSNAEVIGQLLNGVTREHLKDFGQPFVLDATNTLEVPEVAFLGAGTDLGDLHANLEALRDSGEVRVWPLYDVDASPKADHVAVSGFVAARVAEVGSLPVPPVPPTPAAPLTFTLQPTMIAVNGAVTDATRRGINGIPVLNPYICKIRLTE